jgi:hypothetical protein
MINFLVGVVVGIVISTVGLTGIARVVDKGIDQTKSVIQEQAK